LKISGIWENDREIGITFKFILLTWILSFTLLTYVKFSQYDLNNSKRAKI
jgi:hypothetical protein